MSEYPKVIRVGGVTITVQDAADEARWLKPAIAETVVLSAPEPAPVAEPDPPAKKKAAAKKKGDS